MLEVFFLFLNQSKKFYGNRFTESASYSVHVTSVFPDGALDIYYSEQ